MTSQSAGERGGGERREGDRQRVWMTREEGGRERMDDLNTYG